VTAKRGFEGWWRRNRDGIAVGGLSGCRRAWRAALRQKRVVAPVQRASNKRSTPCVHRASNAILHWRCDECGEWIPHKSW
jgi:hypothetical protein